VQRHEGDGQVGRVVEKRQPDGVRERDRMALGVGRGDPDAGHRGVEADDPVTRPGQHAPKPALAAAPSTVRRPA
jgi:hypothetical protein